VRVIHQINKPVQRNLTAAEVNGGETAIVGVNIKLEYGQILLVDGVRADVVLGDATDVGTGNNVIVRGAQGRELTEDLTTIAQINQGSSIFLSDELFPGRSYAGRDYFGAPEKLFNLGFYSFSLSFLPDPAILPFAGNATCTLTVFGEVLNKNDRQFPYSFR
jgi:hypothetical protein